MNPIPKAYVTPTPYLIVRGAAKAIEWYTNAFGAEEYVRLADSSGHVMHAEIRIGESPLMLADEFPDEGFSSPDTIGGSPVLLLLYVENVDEVFERAIRMGALARKAVSDQFDGDRRGTLSDPFGHTWLLASRLENLSASTMKERFNELMSGGSEPT